MKTILAIGDSIAHGLVGLEGVTDGGTFPGKGPKVVLDHIRSLTHEQLAGYDFIALSGGPSNCTTDVGLVEEEIRVLVEEKHVDPKKIRLIKVGTREDIAPCDGELESIAQKRPGITTVPFIPGPDHVHPWNYDELHLTVLDPKRTLENPPPEKDGRLFGHHPADKEPVPSTTQGLGHLNAAQTIEMQKLLKHMNYDLGTFGKNQDGLDGREGGSHSFTQTELHAFMQSHKIAADASFEKIIAQMKEADAQGYKATSDERLAVPQTPPHPHKPQTPALQPK